MKRILSACFLFCVTCACADAPDNSPALLLANIWQENLDVRDYWVSEKLDGVRAYWNGEKLVSRSGYVIHTPAWFTAGFPERALDGELWAGRGQFAWVNAAVRTYPPKDEQWRKIGYYVFELPKAKGTFTERLEQLDRILAAHPLPHLHKIEQFRLTDNKALNKKLEHLTAAGAEGLMLHHQDARYVTGRQNALLKLKTFQDDEAVVIGYTEGKGKYQGLLGALIVETEDGRRFKLGSGLSDQQRANPPAIGSTVTYKYYGFTQNGLPRFASFLRVRRPAGNQN